MSKKILQLALSFLHRNFIATTVQQFKLLTLYLRPRDSEMIRDTWMFCSPTLIMGNHTSILKLAILVVDNNPRRTHSFGIMQIWKGIRHQIRIITTLLIGEGLCTVIARNLSISVTVVIVPEMLSAKKNKSKLSLGVKPIILTLSGECCICSSVMVACLAYSAWAA